MEDIANLLPKEWATKLAIAYVVTGALGRAYNALKGGGGLAGVYKCIVFGTGTDPKVTAAIKDLKEQTEVIVKP